MRTVDYILGHREKPPAPGLVVLRADFGAETPEPEPPEPEPPGDWARAIRDIAAEVQRLVRVAQQHRPPYDAPYMTYQAAMAQILDHDIGPIHDYMEQVVALLPKAPSPPPPTPGPAPTPPPVPRFLPPVPAGGIYGETKWLPGSTGCDIFLPRNSPVVAPADVEIVHVVGGTGATGGAEVILALPDRAWAWRYRHVQASVRAGQRAAAGERVGVVLDPSLDILCPEPVRAMPDGWQHLDLSVNTGSVTFPPTGGGGGNYPAAAWLREVGYQGRVLPRTPGPTDCGWPRAAAERWLARICSGIEQ